ncbi:hypothetical protein HY493_02290 [Candidatus Woesearchaeota archaeon]|nr:hypothetical protein [Candidatus Woesearchaeota archaeon]
MRDIVFPDNNEAAFLARAKTLGIEELVFVYEDPARISGTEGAKPALLAHPQGIGKARAKTEIVLLKSSDQDLHTIEHTAPDILFDLEASPKFDALHQRASGLNHILAAVCAKNGVTIAFAFNSLLAAPVERRAILLGRIAQNIQLCRKYRVPMKIASFARTPGGMRSPEDLAALFRVLGMRQQEIRDASD